MMKYALVVLLTLIFSGCSTVPEKDVSTFTFTTEIYSDTKGNSKPDPAPYLLATITDPAEKDAGTAYQFTAVYQMKCATSIEMELSKRGFNRVFSQEKAKYIVWFDCDELLGVIDRGYKATPKYNSSSTSTYSSGTISSNTGNTMAYGMTSYGSTQELDSIDISKKQSTIHLKGASVVILEKGRDYSSKLRYWIWEAGSTWSKFPHGNLLAPYTSMLIEDIFGEFDSWQTSGVLPLDSSGSGVEKLNKRSILKTDLGDPLASVPFEEHSFPYILKFDWASRFSLDTEWIFRPWGKDRTTNLGSLLYTQSTDRSSGLRAQVTIRCVKDEPMLDLIDTTQGDLFRSIKGQFSEIMAFEYLNKRPFAEDIFYKESDSKAIVADDFLSALIQSLQKGKGRQKDSIILYFPEIDKEIMVRKEGFSDLMDETLSACMPKHHIN